MNESGFVVGRTKSCFVFNLLRFSQVQLLWPVHNYPTIDHVIPVARGGEDTASNWVSTSMRNNSRKADSLIEEVDMKLVPPGTMDDWDGKMRWYVDYLEANPQWKDRPWHRSWGIAARRGLAALNLQ